MSRFSTTNDRGDQFVYGYDRPLQYYFLDKVTKSGFRSLVGLLSNVYGSAHNLLEMCDRLKVKLPRVHREELLLDLPLSELTSLRVEPLTGPEYGDPDPDDSFIEDPPGYVSQFDPSLDQGGAA